jgi:hypothetical protein
MSDKTRKAIAARLARLAEIQNPKKPVVKPKETGGAEGRS